MGLTTFLLACGPREGTKPLGFLVASIIVKTNFEAREAMTLLCQTAYAHVVACNIIL